MKFIAKLVNVNCADTESFSITHLAFLWSHIRLELADEEVSVVWTEFRCSACTAEGAEGERANISFSQKLKSRE